MAVARGAKSLKGSSRMNCTLNAQAMPGMHVRYIRCAVPRDGVRRRLMHPRAPCAAHRCLRACRVTQVPFRRAAAWDDDHVARNTVSHGIIYRCGVSLQHAATLQHATTAR